VFASARHAVKILTAAVVPASLLFAGTTAAAASQVATHAAAPSRGADHGPLFKVRQILDGARLHHSFIPAGGAQHRSEALSGPDDLTVLGHHLYTAFQNGVGPQGEPSPDGNTDSTIVEFTAAGRVVRQWDVTGKCDGLTADAGRQLVFATVNEDAHSSIYTVTPGAALGRQVQHYRYARPLPHHGGTDAISVYHGLILISASAPGTTGPAAPQPGYPALYLATFDRAAHVVRVFGLFSDEARAILANQGARHGQTVRLALVDPDSSELVPASARRFAGAFMLTSQADQEQIFLRPGKILTVLRLSQSVDDTAWARSRSGRLYGTDASSDTVDVVTGGFSAGAVFTAVTPCDAGDAPATCPGPGFPANYLGSLNPWTGHITRVPLRGPAFEPQGMVFISPGWVVTPG
jgi:hypothetical protein